MPWNGTAIVPRNAPIVLPLNPHFPASQQASKSSPYITYLHTGFHFRKEQPCRHHCREEGVLEFYLTIWKPGFSALASFPTGAGGCQNQPGDLFPCGFNVKENIPLSMVYIKKVTQARPTKTRERLLPRKKRSFKFSREI